MLLRLLPRLAAVVLGGVLYGLAYPPLALRPLAWVALVPLLLVVRRSRPTAAAGYGALYAVVGTCMTVDWLPRTVATYYQQPAAVGLGLFAGVMLLTVVPWVAAFAAVYGLLARRPSPLVPFTAAAAWVAAELGRATVLSGNPWVLLGYSQVGVDRVVQIADLAGVYGIGFVVAAVNAALAEGIVGWRGDPRQRRAARAGAGGVALLLGATLFYGTLQVARAPTAAAPLSVGIVQANVDLGAQWRDELYGQNLDLLLRLTLESLRATQPALVVWPETAMTFFLEREPAYRAAIAHVLAPWSTELVAGGVYVDGDGDGAAYFNSAFALASDGHILGRYDKQRLLPFAEYFPWPRLDLLRRNFGRVREFTPGGERPLLPTPAGPAGVLICNEALFGADAARRVRQGAAVLLNLSNDSWMNDEKFSGIAFDMSALRAVEQRRYLIRASTSGPSGIVDPYGRVTARTALTARAVSGGSVAPRHDLTAYARIGDAFAMACALAAAAAVALRLRTARG